jgi:hypothetical protein
MHRCFVIGCGYVAESAIEDYQVCALHDAPQVRSMLERLERPHAYWCEERPIVLPCGVLTEKDFVPHTGVGAIRAADDPQLALVDETPTRMVLPCYDLTRSDFLGL